MNIVDDAKREIERANKHNQEQLVIQRMNEPLLANCKKWLEKYKSVDSQDVELNKLADMIERFLDTGEGLNETKKYMESLMIEMTRKKKEELDAYRY